MDELVPTGEQSQPDDGGTATPEGTTTKTAPDTTGAPEGEAAGEGGGDGGEAPTGEEGEGSGEEAGAPEEYAAFTMPEGVEADQGIMDAFNPMAKEMGLTQEHAQKLVDLQTGAIGAEAQAREAAFQTQLAGWKEAGRKDPEFGGDKLAANTEAAAKFVARVGTPELQQLLTDTGLEHHPELQRIFHRCAQAISEDTHVSGEGGGSKPTTMAERMFTDMAPPQT